MFHHHKELLVSFDDLKRIAAFAYLVELDDMGVSDFLEDFNLPSDSLHVLLVVDLLFL